MERELSRYRQEIDAIDRQIIEQLARRFDVAKEIAKIKRTYDLPVVQPDRKQEVERRYIRHGEQLRLAKDFMSHLYHLIHQETCRVEDEWVANSSSEQGTASGTGVKQWD
ncbi:chorismate mutase [Alicyclobacillus tolerans]|uniref:chorismate mutase n=1 Tax=Alicyclobacillus tolerans TaxID=90970 RepID=UPI001F37DF16|nr:chorismate mutase [Alicyclobacillus tolerans]MCF8564318.1 chorismate mutase [Alicyclobacillus tolerans]